jgi:hypothetical protein
VREAQQDQNPEYNPAAYGMNRAEEQLIDYADRVIPEPDSRPTRYLLDHQVFSSRTKKHKIIIF